MIFKILANYGPLLLAAMGQTLLLALWSLFFACLIGLFVGILSVLKSRVCNIIATIFVDIIRGVPMIVLAFFVYFGVPMLMNDNLNWAAMTGSKFITGIYAEADLDKLVSDTGKSLRQTLQSLSPWPAVLEGNVQGRAAAGHPHNDPLNHQPVHHHPQGYLDPVGHRLPRAGQHRQECERQHNALA